MRRTRKRALLSLLLLAAMVLLFFYYAFVHSGLTSEPRLTARDFHDFQPAPAAVDAPGAGADLLHDDEDSSLAEVKRLLGQLEHQQGIDRLAKDARALATAPTPTRRRPRIEHRFHGSAGDELIGIDADADPDAEADDAESLPPGTVEAAEEAYARAATDIRASCHPYRRFGPKGDGGWSVCLAGPYRPLTGGCLSLSFGVANIWSYDDQVASQLGCRVLAFDPSLTRLGNHTRPVSGVQFYKLGLHSQRGRHRGWPVDSLQGLLDSLAPGGPAAVVDLLKLDIEGSEWPALDAALDSGVLQRRVKQLALEFHSKEARPWPSLDTEVADYASYLGTMRRLVSAGFRMWLSEPNSEAGSMFYSHDGARRKRHCCYNAYYLNTRFLPAVNASQLAMENRMLTDLHSVRLRLPLRLPDVAAHRASPQLAERLYYDLMSAVHADCPDWRRLGPQQGDSGYDVCLSGPFALRSGCLVYSFGVADQYGFEDQLAGRDFQCRVRMFDPSLTQLGEHKRGPRQWVHLVGLGALDEERPDTGWQVNSLQTLMRRFGNEADTLDLVKVDIELDEWPALEAAVADGSLARVKQLILETHTREVRGESQVTGPSDYLRFTRIWLGLYRLGFRQWRSRENPRGHFLSPSGRRRPCCQEHSLINVKFL